MINSRLRNSLKIPLFTAAIVICSYLQVPYTIPFTMQLFAIAMALLLLGGVNGLTSIALYLAIGAIGLPVFAGFAGGVGHIFSANGGFLLGMVAFGLVFCALEKTFGRSLKKDAIYLAICLVVLYTVGVLWLTFVFSDGNALSTGAVIAAYVLPFVLPDIIKLALALLLVKRLRRAL